MTLTSKQYALKKRLVTQINAMNAVTLCGACVIPPNTVRNYLRG